MRKKIFIYSLFILALILMQVGTNLIGNAYLRALVFMILGWLSYNLIYNKNNNWEGGWLIFTGFLSIGGTWGSLYLLCQIKPIRVCNSNLFIASMLPGLMLLVGWILTIIEKPNKKRIENSATK
jgi:hypothetical protein